MSPSLHRRAIRPLLVVGLSLGVFACAEGDHRDLASPPQGMGPHQPNYVITASVERGEMAANTPEDPQIATGTPPSQPAHQPWTDPTMDSAPAGATGIEIDASLAQACQIPKAEAFFDTDSADLHPSAKAALDAMFDCFTTGPMKGHRLAITGHTDPQGSAAYNEKLGQKRADAVAAYLASKGMQAEEMAPDSQGEAMADKDDPAMWPYNRKVVLDIAEQTEEPSAEGSAAEGE